MASARWPKMIGTRNWLGAECWPVTSFSISHTVSM